MIQYLKRLFGLTSNIDLYENERLKIANQISEINKKYLVQRKTQLTFLIIIYTFLLVMSYIEIFSNMPKDTEDGEVMYYVSRVGTGFIAIKTLQWIMIILSRYFWNNYKLSSRFMISSYFISVILPLVMFYIPYGTIINELMIQTAIYGLLLLIIMQSLQPMIFLVHNIIMSSNSLARYYKNTQEFRIVSSLFCAFYIPFVIMIFGILFQIDGAMSFNLDELQFTYDYKIIGLCVTYLTLIIMPTLINNKYQQIVYYLTCIPFLILLYIILKNHGNNMFEIYGQGFINNIFVGMFVSDSLIMSITSFAKRQDSESPHNLYDNNNTNNDTNTIELVSEDLTSTMRYDHLDNNHNNTERERELSDNLR